MRFRERIALAGIAATVAGVAAWSYVTRDSAVRERVHDLLAQHVRAPCHVGTAEFSFLDGLVVRDLTVFDPQDPLGPPLVQVAEARLDYLLDLTGDGPRLTNVYLRGPTLRLVAEDDGRFAGLGVFDPPGGGAGPGSMPLVQVDGATIEVGHPAFLAPGRTVTAGNVDLRAERDGETVRVLAHGDIAQLGRLRAEVIGRADGREGDVTLTLADVRVDDETLALLPTAVAETLRSLRVRARAEGVVEARVHEGAVRELGAEIELTEGSARVRLDDTPGTPQPEPFDVTEVGGSVRVVGGDLLLDGVRGTVFDAPVHIAGRIAVGLPTPAPPQVPAPPDVEITTRLENVHVGPHVVPHLPDHLRRVQHAFDLSGTRRHDVRGRGAAAVPPGHRASRRPRRARVVRRRDRSPTARARAFRGRWTAAPGRCSWTRRGWTSTP